MKIILSVIIIFLSVSIGYAQQKKTADLWMTLSVEAQNFNYRLYDSDEKADIFSYLDQLDSLNKALDNLVKASELESCKVILKHSNLNKEFLVKEMGRHKQKYGHYVAHAMCDMDKLMNFSWDKSNKNLKLHIRLPKKEMKNFIEGLKKLQVIKIEMQNKSQ